MSNLIVSPIEISGEALTETICESMESLLTWEGLHNMQPCLIKLAEKGFFNLFEGELIAVSMRDTVNRLANR